ncbi:hypothetical protein F511_43247 [Dorcoceras hygrometricum]|uniref:Uncharacterized protein n=1 Tax=Dorcoceras hygrometricum TaxID=472368 RepID=A0A2Z7CB16_9LAMI|nr:hypothetical protein F511_43247 [Dorcoceras hygrometricum]
MWDFDCIVRMDVLSSYRATVDCFHGVVRFRPQSDEKWNFYGQDSQLKIPLVFAILLNGVLRFGESVLLANLIRLVMWDFDCIVRMDVLSSYRATVDCFHGVVRFRPQSGEKWNFYGQDSQLKIPLVSAMEMFCNAQIFSKSTIRKL